MKKKKRSYSWYKDKKYYCSMCRHYHYRDSVIGSMHHHPLRKRKD